MSALFADRSIAGGALAQQLQAYAGRDDVVVLALPRGGDPVAWEVAQALGVKLDVLVVRRLCVPYQTKLALGAIAGGGAVFIDRQIVASSGVSPQQFEDVLAAGCQDLARCRALYRGAREPAVLQGRTVIVVDDGVATGASMHAALTALRVAKPEWIVVAVPAAPPGAQDRIGTAADEFVSVMSPPDFRSVGQYYRDFGQVSDEQVRGLLSYADLHRT
jgi:putative phosphoribosyl transferase